jgi:pimeloyl-ACP methyl ester carboxylesterase
MGHSWGGQAAMQLAYDLNAPVSIAESVKTLPDGTAYIGTDVTYGSPIPIDLLVMFDSEDYARGALTPVTGGIAPMSVPSNVRRALNFWAINAIGDESTYYNGINEIGGAINIGIAATHYSILDRNDLRVNGREKNARWQDQIQLNQDVLARLVLEIRWSLPELYFR